MSNLLPPEYIKKNITEYRLRVAGTALSVLAVLLALSIVLLVPSYLITTHKHAVILTDPAWQDGEDKVASEKNQKELERVIMETNSILDALIQTRKLGFVSEQVIANIVRYKEPSITMSGIFYDAHDDGGELSVRGVAETRQSLISFADALKRDPLFTGVDLPISNLVKDRNISFTIAIKLKNISNVGNAPPTTAEENQ